MKMFKRALLIGAAGSLALGGAALADVSGLIGNTLAIKVGDAPPVKIQLHADGGYKTLLPNGSADVGTWAEKDGRLCFTQTSPAPAAGAPPSFCPAALTGHKAGDTWTAPDEGAGGVPATMTVTAGQ